jgi:hypothetical protein
MRLLEPIRTMLSGNSEVETPHTVKRSNSGSYALRVIAEASIWMQNSGT